MKISEWCLDTRVKSRQCQACKWWSTRCISTSAIFALIVEFVLFACMHSSSKQTRGDIAWSKLPSPCSQEPGITQSLTWKGNIWYECGRTGTGRQTLRSATWAVRASSNLFSLSLLSSIDTACFVPHAFFGQRFVCVFCLLCSGFLVHKQWSYKTWRIHHACEMMPLLLAIAISLPAQLALIVQSTAYTCAHVFLKSWWNWGYFIFKCHVTTFQVQHAVQLHMHVLNAVNL
jgi:hypothetical protein